MVVGRGEKIYSWLLLKSLLGGTSCWDDRPPKRGNLRGNRWVHALRVRREGINRGTKRVRLCLARVCVAQCGRQVHPDQTKAVKGQDRKILVTAGAIKRPLLCPVERVEKQSIFYNVKRKNRAREKEKKIRTKTEKKRKKTKKERRELVQGACINRSVSLSPPSNLTFLQKRKQGFSLWDNNHSGQTPSKPLIPMAGFFLGDYLH